MNSENIHKSKQYQFSFQILIQQKIKALGADLIRFVDVSSLSSKQNGGFPTAILLGIVLSKEYLRSIADDPCYIEKKKKNDTIHLDEFHLIEKKTDEIADQVETFLKTAGYKAMSQSENNLEQLESYDKDDQSTPLPHKTIAGMAGLGWIGKHNLLVTKEYGSAISMCTVLTNAPLETTSCNMPESCCGNCHICVDACSPNALKGITWKPGISRDELINADSCTTCIQCMVQCPWTKKYMNRK